MSALRSYNDEAVGSVARNKKRSTALSCAECRRLKLRCDRKFPCSACVKRGCSQICPEGSLTTGKGNRFVLANTESLHEKISELSHRVRSLEDALSVAHSTLHNDRHPLLSDELLKIKNPLEREVVAEAPKPPDEEDAIDAVGSLSISSTGRTNFYGQTANAWYLLQNEEGDHSDGEGDNALALPVADVPWLSHAFPFSPSLNQPAAVDLRNTLLANLPDAPTARTLVDCYFLNAAWMYHPVAKEEFDSLVFSRIYPYATSADSPSDNEVDRDAGSRESHRLGLLYIILAVGILVDLSRPSHDPSAIHYYQLAKAALSLDAIMEEPSITAIQALVIMCHYMFLNDVDTQRWTLMGIVVKLAQSIGLHRDSTRWKLSPEETKLRRKLFWEIYVYDSWQSLTYGRPPSLSTSHIDCKMMFDPKSPPEDSWLLFDSWKHRFSSECLSVVHDQIFGARAPSYATVMELDKRVRQYPIPPVLQVPGFGIAPMYNANNETPSSSLTMQRYIVLAIKEVVLLYMHRGFFAKAMTDNSSDPLSGKYGHSVLRAQESSAFFVKLIRSLWIYQQQLAERNWFLFTHVFSCAIVLGSIPVKCPGMTLAKSALRDLDQAYDLFSKLGEKSRAAKVLPILAKLRDRAETSMNEYMRQQKEQGGSFVNPKREPSQDRLPKHEDELEMLGGKTRLVTRKTTSPSSASSRGSRSPVSSPPVAHTSPPPITPVSPTSTNSLMSQSQHIQTTLYGTNDHLHNLHHQTQQTQQVFSSPIESAGVPAYPHSPEMALFGSGHLLPEQYHLHLHQTQAQEVTHMHTHWGHDSAMMGYPSTSVSNQHNELPQHNYGSGHGMNHLNMNNNIPSNGFEYGTYYDMHNIPQQSNIYSPIQGQMYMTQESVSPQDNDVSGAYAWSNLMEQFGSS